MVQSKAKILIFFTIFMADELFGRHHRGHWIFKMWSLIFFSPVIDLCDKINMGTKSEQNCFFEQIKLH
jgi:hypothetical protein